MNSIKKYDFSSDILHFSVIVPMLCSFKRVHFQKAYSMQHRCLCRDVRRFTWCLLSWIPLRSMWQLLTNTLKCVFLAETSFKFHEIHRLDPANKCLPSHETLYQKNVLFAGTSFNVYALPRCWILLKNAKLLCRYSMKHMILAETSFSVYEFPLWRIPYKECVFTSQIPHKAWL